MSSKVKANEPIRWGIIGTGWMPRTHMVSAINSAPLSTVAAVLSSDERRASRFAAEFGVPKSFSSLDAMLVDDDIDAVFVCSTNELHKSQTLAAAAAGKHVLCEKPLAMSIEDAVEMVTACRRAGVVLGTNHYRRTKGSIQIIRGLIASGKIGVPLIARASTAFSLPPVQQTWRLTSAASGGGVVRDITVHDADVLRYLLDDEVEEVTAMAGRSGLLPGTLEDVALTTMRFRSGTIASSTASFCTPGGITSLEILGSSGSILANDVLGVDPGGQIFLRRGDTDLEPVEIGDESPHYIDAVAQFNAAVRGEGSPAVTGEEGLRSLSVALAAAESAERGTAVRIADVLADETIFAR